MPRRRHFGGMKTRTITVACVVATCEGRVPITVWRGFKKIAGFLAARCLRCGRIKDLRPYTTSTPMGHASPEA